MCRKFFILTSLALVLALVGTNVVFGGTVIERRVNKSSDDNEEKDPAGDAEGVDSTDIEMPYEDEGTPPSDPMIVAMRWEDITIPKGAEIIEAYIEFEADETKNGSDFVSLIIEGELSPDAATFAGTDSEIANRPRTTTKAVWEPVAWTATSQKDQTSNVAAVIEEIVNQDGWKGGNALVLIIGDNPDNPSKGIRCAEAFDGESANAPLLHIEFTSKYAFDPSPPDGILYEDTWASLRWTAGDTAATHDVYMSDNFDDVNDRTPAAFRGNQPLPFLTVGFIGFAYPDGLAPGTTYYWAVDEVEADGATKYEGPVWSFWIPSKKAYDPSPRDGSKGIDSDDATLSWTPGFGAKLHSVYFGDDLDTVTNAVGAPPLGAMTYSPGTLEKDKMYYWRVDEFNPPELVKGDVWSFRTLPDIVITDPDMIGWWKFDYISGNTVIDWSGYGNDGTLGGDPKSVEGAIDLGLDLDGNDYVSLDPVADDLTSTDFTVSIWIKTTQSSEGNVIASNDNASGHVFLFGVKDGNVYVDDGPETQSPPAVNDNKWHMITFVKNGSNAYIYTDGVEVGNISSTIDVTTETRWSIGQEWDDSTPSNFYTGMVDDCRFFNKALTPDEVVELMRGDPLVAWNPKPANNQVIDVEQGKQPLSWSAGDNASQHDVYFGTDRDALDLADTSTADVYRGRQAGTSYSPPEGLPWGTGPYYWRIDEINADGSVSAGSIWGFSVADYLIVEDFESYDDIDPPQGEAGNRIFDKWIDGYGVPSNGAQAGNLFPPYAETTIVQSGGQSMPLFYTNTAGVMNSEAVQTVSSLRNWTLHDVGALSIWFRGNPASVGSFTEGPVGTVTMTGSGTDITGSSDEFHYAYKMLSGAGSIIARVNSVTNTSEWAKAGVMIRETLSSDSAHAMAFITPAQGAVFEYRDTAGADNVGAAGQETGITAPHWVKIERDVAGYFTASHSTNGSTWMPMGGAISQRIVMDTTVYIGLALTSHNAGATCEAKFSNVSTTGNVTGLWTSQDIGIASNAAEPMYVSVANATGAPAVVAHPDPAAATTDVWTEWVIPLQEFADKGINLTNIDKIAVGLGAQSGQAAAGGSGTVFFDDFRLYRLAP